MSSSVEKLVDVITAEKAGFLPASILPCWRFCQFRIHCFKFFFEVVVGRAPPAPHEEVTAASCMGVAPWVHGGTGQHSHQAASPIRDSA